MNYFRCGGGSKKQSEGFIYNTRPCAFNTGYVPNANTKIIMKALPTYYTMNGTSSYNTMFASTPNGDANKYKRFGFESSANNNIPRYWRAGEGKQGSWAGYPQNADAIILSAPLIFEAYGRTIKWYFPDDELNYKSISISEETGQIDAGTTPIALFGKNYNSGTGYSITDYGLMTLYYFDIYENDVLLHHFIPAYNNNQYCLYDTVDGVYIYDTANNGAGVHGFIPAT